MGARRFWMYPKGTCADYAPLIAVYPGGDEYGNSTIVVRLPAGRGVVMAYNWPLRRELEPCEGRIEYGAVNDEGAPEHNPLPLASPDLGGLDPKTWRLVRREVRSTPWTPVVILPGNFLTEDDADRGFAARMAEIAGGETVEDG